MINMDQDGGLPLREAVQFYLKPSIQTTLIWIHFGSKSSTQNLCLLQTQVSYL